MRTAATVVICGAGSREPSWDRVRDCLQSVGAQGCEQVVLCEIPELKGEVPEDIRDIVPGLKILPCHGAEGKLAAAKSSAAPILVFLEADCMPQAGWLQALLDVFQYYPEVAAVSGLVTGAKLAWWRKLLSWQTAGPARRLANTNVAFRREAYLDCPQQERPDAVRHQTAAMRRARYVLWTEPAMRVIRDRRGLRQLSGALDYSAARPT